MQEISLENIIVGRVEPHIYAFTTGTVPNYLKVGDTYRPVSVRLKEWKEHFPDLEKKYEKIAKVSDAVYFRDFAIHCFLENEKNCVRLQKKDVSNDIYYSREFFKNATVQEIIEAIEDITCDYQENGGKYKFYNAETRLAETFTYVRNENYEPRPNQKATIERFKNAVNAGRTNLLMYAVMRFGKSFTSMCCAAEMGAKIVSVVSAKADVKNEWKKTVESHIKFSDYIFLDGSSLLENENIIKETLSIGQKAVIFLTLQDLQGDEIKEKHKEVFESQIDLLIVDETHFGARAEKYGQVLREMGKTEAKATINPKDADDYIESNEAEIQINKVLKSKVKLHLSGTPYRILMGSEFTQEDIIAFYQFSDIVKDQETWDKENILSDDVKEWDNPYYGFPQMIRFAFNPNESSRKRLQALKEKGISFAFSALLRPKSIKASDDNSYKKFIYQQEVLELLEVIDGSKKDNEVLGFLDYDKIKNGNMCRHIVMVLPYCASCDAMEELIRNNADKFKNLNNYQIINISGVNISKELNEPKKIKKFIHNCEQEGKRTLTLTVNRMLTGSTVEEWDTMIFLKDTASPQEYDQAIFRLQNQYIKKYVDDDGNVIKYNMKPQTLLVDFEPGRMFSMQEQKAQIYNVNVDEAGNSKLEDRLKEELRISPIIVMNSDKIEQVEATDIITAVSEYSKNRGVAEETLEIPVDLSLLNIDVIRRAIERENELGSKSGLTINASNGKGRDANTNSGEEFPYNNSGKSNEKPETKQSNNDDDDEKDPVKQFRSYYARILFLAFLTKDTVISLEDIILKTETENNARIAKNIGVSKGVLECIQNNINKFILRDLDYKIHNLNKLSHDTTIDPIERASVAIRKFGRLGVSEIITPQKICDEMISLIPDDCFINAVKNGHKILDIAGKAGEFALAVYRRYIKLGYDIEQIKDTIYTIPTSGITYEFTRMIYEMLGLNIENIATKFNAYDLLKVKDKNDNINYDKVCAILKQNKSFDEIKINDNPTEKGEEKVKFDAIVGNPPYQVSDGGGMGSSAIPIYNLFIEQAKSISPHYLSMIIPSRWFSGGRGLDDFRNKMLTDDKLCELVDYWHASDLFPGVEIKGGVCYFLWDKNHQGDCHIVSHQEKLITTESVRPLLEPNMATFIRDNNIISILRKVKLRKEDSFSNIVSSNDPFGFDIREKNSYKRVKPKYSLKCTEGSIPFYYNGWRNEGIGFVDKDSIRKGMDLVDKIKVLIPKAWGSGNPKTDWLNPFIAEDNSVCTETYLVVGPFKNKKEAQNAITYIQTRFFHLMVSILKITQNTMQQAYSLVPLQDFSKEWNDDQLYAKYNLSEDEITFIEGKIKPME